MTAQLRLGWGVIVVFSAILASTSLTPTQPIRLAWNKVESVKPVTELPAVSPLSAEQSAITEHLSAKYEKPISLVSRIVKSAYKEASKMGLPPLLVLAIIEKESSLEPKSVNGYGAKGLMQVVPRFHKDKLQGITGPEGLLHPETNIKVGSAILAEYIQAHDGNIEQGLKQYSGNAKNYFHKVKQFSNELERVKKKHTDGIPA